MFVLKTKDVTFIEFITFVLRSVLCYSFVTRAVVMKINLSIWPLVVVHVSRSYIVIKFPGCHGNTFDPALNPPLDIYIECNYCL